ncbi:hypothetical protein Z043_104084, partial [Scleropages formosus]
TPEDTKKSDGEDNSAEPSPEEEGEEEGKEAGKEEKQEDDVLRRSPRNRRVRKD